MSNFNIHTTWVDSDDGDIVLKNTTAEFTLKVNDVCLTQNVNCWTKSIDDSVVVSTYPLAKWFAYNWWRLENELLVPNDIKPDYNWRSAHELGAANHGFVWPRILFVSDGKFINIWSDPVSTPKQSVNYIGKLTGVQSVLIDDFQTQISSLISSSIDRLSGCDNDLKNLWNLVREDSNDPTIKNIRKLEALMGYDPEDCPDSILEKVLEFQKNIGCSSISELAPLLGNKPELLEQLKNQRSIEGNVQISSKDISVERNIFDPPWKLGVDAARILRAKNGLGGSPIANKVLYDFMGVTGKSISEYEAYSSRPPVAIGKNIGSQRWSFSPRRNSSTGKRFEWARFLGDIVTQAYSSNEWLVSSDFSSSRQKCQKAFAAEFLCPIDSLVEYLDGDYSEAKQEDAAGYFQVSEQTVYSLLANNGIIYRPEISFPYAV